MRESIDKIKDLCIDLEIELEKIDRSVEIQKLEDGLHVVKADTGEDCSVGFVLTTIYVSKINDFINEYAEKIHEKLEEVDPDWKKTIEEYLENRK